MTGRERKLIEVAKWRHLTPDQLRAILVRLGVPESAADQYAREPDGLPFEIRRQVNAACRAGIVRP